jgi:hypothetical protein
LGKAAAEGDGVACSAEDAVANAVRCFVDFVEHETWLDSRCWTMINLVSIKFGVAIGEGFALEVAHPVGWSVGATALAQQIVTGALDNEPDIVLLGKSDRGGDMVRTASIDSVDWVVAEIALGSARAKWAAAVVLR